MLARKSHPDLPGCFIYGRARSRYIYLDYTDPLTNERVRESSGQTTEAAAWGELRRRLRLAVEPSWKDAVVHFFQTRTDLKPTTMHGYTNSVRVLDSYIGHLLLSEIDSQTLKKFMVERRLEVSDAAVRRDFAAGSTIFTTAQETMPRLVPEINPFKMISKRHLKEVKRRRFLTTDEYERIEKALTEEWHRVALEVFVYTGMRHREVRLFTRDWIKWENGDYGEIHLPVEVAKSGEPRVIPLFPKLRRTLEDWCARSEGDWVFSSWDKAERRHAPYSSFQGFWRGARTRAGVKDVRLHDLRHTFASWWVQKGGEITNLKELLGHADLRMVERYAHLNTEAQRAAVKEINDLK